MSGKPSTEKDTSSTATAAPALTAPEATAAPATVSILGTNVAAKASAPTPWQKFTSCLTACFVATAPIIQAAIKFGMDAATLALKDKIENDQSLSDQQKAALTGVTSASLEAIRNGVMAQVAEQAKVHANAGNPALTGLVDAAINTGVVDAFVPELGLKAASATPDVSSSPKFAITTTGKLNAAVAQLSNGGVVDLSAATGALVLQDSVVKAMVKKAVMSSNLPPEHKASLLKTGAAQKFVEGGFDEHNKTVAQAQLAALANAVPLVPGAVVGEVADTAHVDVHLDSGAGVGLAGANAVDADAVAGHA